MIPELKKLHGEAMAGSYALVAWHALIMRQGQSALIIGSYLHIPTTYNFFGFEETFCSIVCTCTYKTHTKMVTINGHPILYYQNTKTR